MDPSGSFSTDTGNLGFCCGKEKQGVAALENLGAKLKRNEQGEIVEVNLAGRRVTDAGLVPNADVVPFESLPTQQPCEETERRM
jgi:hypothetical protein